MKTCYINWDGVSCLNPATHTISQTGIVGYNIPPTLPICQQCATRILAASRQVLEARVAFIVPVAEISSETFADIIKREVAEKQKH